MHKLMLLLVLAVATLAKGNDLAALTQIDHLLSEHANETDHDLLHHHDEIQPKDEVGLWVAACSAIIAISLCGIFGVLVIPIMQKVFYQHLIQFLVALAIGTLAGDALLHLYPHALLADLGHGHSEDHEDFHRISVWKGFTGEDLISKFS